LPLPGLHYARVAVADVTDVVYEVEVGTSPLIEQILSLASYDVDRVAVSEGEGRINMSPSLFKEGIYVLVALGKGIQTCLGRETCPRLGGVERHEMGEQFPGWALRDVPGRVLRSVCTVLSGDEYRHAQAAEDEREKDRKFVGAQRTLGVVARDDGCANGERVGLVE